MKLICWSFVLGLVAISALAGNKNSFHDQMTTDPKMVPTITPHEQMPIKTTDERFVDDEVKYSDVIQLLTTWKSEDNIKRIVACDNSQYVQASCPVGETIYVRNGFFGRDDSATCIRNGGLMPLPTKRCSSPLALQKLKQSCNNKNTCLLQSTGSLFGYHCFGPSMYIRMTYYCIPRISTYFKEHMKTLSPKLSPKIDAVLFQILKELPKSEITGQKFVFPTETPFGMTPLMQKTHVKEIVACENSINTWARCPEGRVISVQYGFYGRDDSQTCSRFDLPIKTTKCAAPLSLLKLKQSCNYKNACLLQPLTSVYGDFCVGTPKYIKMSYQCLDVQQLLRNTNVETLLPIILREKLGNVVTSDLTEDQVLFQRLVKELLRNRLPKRLEEMRPFGGEQIATKKEQLLNQLIKQQISRQHGQIGQFMVYGDVQQQEFWKNPMTDEVRRQHLVKQDMGFPISNILEQYETYNKHDLNVQQLSEKQKLETLLSKMVRERQWGNVAKKYKSEDQTSNRLVEELMEKRLQNQIKETRPFQRPRPFGREQVDVKKQFLNQWIKEQIPTPHGQIEQLMDEGVNQKELWKNPTIKKVLKQHLVKQEMGLPFSTILEQYETPNEYGLNVQQLLEKQKLETLLSKMVGERQWGNVAKKYESEDQASNRLVEELMENRLQKQFKETRPFQRPRPFGRKQLNEKKQFLNQWIKEQTPRPHGQIEQVVVRDVDQKESWKNPMTEELRRRHVVRQEMGLPIFSNIQQLESPYELVVCENDTFTLSCPVNHVVNVVNGYFGRTNIETCQNKPILPSPITCTSPNSLVVLRRQCHGYERCVLKASHSMFGYHCMDMQSYIKMTYKCVLAL